MLTVKIFPSESPTKSFLLPGRYFRESTVIENAARELCLAELSVNVRQLARLRVPNFQAWG